MEAPTTKLKDSNPVALCFLPQALGWLLNE